MLMWPDTDSEWVVREEPASPANLNFRLVTFKGDALGARMSSCQPAGGFCLRVATSFFGGRHD